MALAVVLGVAAEDIHVKEGPPRQNLRPYGPHGPSHCNPEPVFKD